MVIEPWPGGRLYEDPMGNDGFLWGRVVDVRRPESLRIEEPFGAHPGAVQGVQIYRPIGDNEKTTVHFAYQAVGEWTDNDCTFIEDRWSELLGSHLKDWVKKVTPASRNPSARTDPTPGGSCHNTAGTGTFTNRSPALRRAATHAIAGPSVLRV